MKGVSIELRCPDHGFERFTIKIVRRFNMPSDTIKPFLRSRPKPEISRVWVGRNVNDEEIQSYLIDYFREKGLWERVITFKLV